MFYSSPKKNLQTFIETKNQEIQTLKQKILGSRITFEDMQTAKSKLSILNKSHLQLQKQDFLQLKQVVKNSVQVVNQLMKKKNKNLEELAEKQKQIGQASQIGVELIGKKQKVQNFWKDVCEVKDKLCEKKEKRNRQILDLEQQIVNRRKQLTMERQIGDQLQQAKIQLKSKMSKVNIDLTTLSQENKKLHEAVKKQLEQITKLEHQHQNDQLKVQNLQLKIEKQEKTSQNLQQKIDAALTFMQRYSQDKLIYLKETQTAYNIDSLLKMCTQSNQKKHHEQKQCQQQIERLQNKICLAQLKRQKLLLEMNQKQQNLKQLKQKGTQLKSILNSIFHQDSSVLKLLADKKVYDSEETMKKSTNFSGMQVKQDMLDLVATSDNFFMPNHMITK